MKRINLIIDGALIEVNLERYFSVFNNTYLIYSMEGADIDNNVKIYVAKIVENNQVVEIDVPEEWNQVKKTIIGIVNDNKECNKLTIEDLDYNLLNNLVITNAKPLRLPQAVLPYLSANIKEFNQINFEDQNKNLETETKKLKEINSDLTNLMNEVNEEFAKNNSLEQTDESLQTLKNNVNIPELDISVNKAIDANAKEMVNVPLNTPIPEDIVNNEVVENKNNNKMEATMEIIMPTKQQFTGNNITEPKKEKTHFSFKNLFIKKNNEDKIGEEQSLNLASQKTSDNIIKEMKIPSENNKGAILPNLTPSSSILEPIIIETSNQDNTNLPPSGFDYFKQETNKSDLINNSNKQEMEVLNIDEDFKFKKLYENEQEIIKSQELKIKKLESDLQSLEVKLDTIKGIVD